jgi:hypothetical protein
MSPDLSPRSLSTPHRLAIAAAAAAALGAIGIAPAAATTPAKPAKVDVSATVHGAATETLKAAVPPKLVVVKHNTKGAVTGVHTKLKLRGMKGGLATLNIDLAEKNGAWSGQIVLSDASTHLIVKGGLHGTPKIKGNTVTWSGKGGVAGRGSVTLHWTL